MAKFQPKFSVGSLISGLSIFFVFYSGVAGAQVFNANTGNENQQASNSSVQFRSVDTQAPKSVSEGRKNQEIRLYMRDFKVYKTLSGITNCSMRFYVESTMKSPISNISYRLKWPEMETPISFDSVQPNSSVYVTYALHGNGCYHMDKTPNIIVNRCRVKNMTQQACTDSIRWVK